MQKVKRAQGISHKGTRDPRNGINKVILLKKIFILMLAEVYHLFYSVAFFAANGRIVILYRETERMNVKRYEVVLGGIILAAGIAIIILILTA